MFRSLHIAATGMVAQETNLDTIANNLANSNTTGYRRQSAQFEDLLYQTVRSAGAPGAGAPSALQLGTGSRVVATSRQFTQGSLSQTGNSLDLAIEGNGFFSVMRPSGDLAYTRAGSFRMDGQGRIVTADGLALEPALSVPTDATGITIASDGTVTAQQPGARTPTQIGQISVTTFANPDGLQSMGHNLFAATAASGEPSTGTAGADGRGTLLQGSLESSNVEVVNEMIDMIRTQRAYEINSKVISAADEMLRNATQMR